MPIKLPVSLQMNSLQIDLVLDQMTETTNKHCSERANCLRNVICTNLEKLLRGRQWKHNNVMNTDQFHIRSTLVNYDYRVFKRTRG